MRRIAAAFIAVLIFVLSLEPCFAKEIIEYEKPEIENSRMAILYEETTDTYLYLKNENDLNPPASMTKVMTAMLVLEYDPDLSGTAKVSADAVSYRYCSDMDDFHLVEGEEIPVAELMDYFLIVSANEAANVLAEYVAGDIDTFIGMMNDKAAELGMTDTVYYDAHGLSESSRISCRDMLTLCRYAMQNEKFVGIVSKERGTLPANEVRTKHHNFKSFNRCMFPNGISDYRTGFEQDICGIKTGFISKSQGNFSSHMQHGDLSFYGVVMHAVEYKTDSGIEVEGRFADMASLFRWARSFELARYKSGEVIDGVGATRWSRKANIKAAPDADLCALYQTGEEPYSVQLNEIGFKVRKGDVIGTMTVEDEFGNGGTADLIAAEDCGINIPVVIAVFAAMVLAAVLTAVFVSKRKKKCAE